MTEDQSLTEPARRGEAWTSEEDRRLYDEFLAHDPMSTIALLHRRSHGGIRARLRRLGLIDGDGQAIEPPPPFQIPQRRRLEPQQYDASSGTPHAHVVFVATTEDGWRVELRSNRSLNQAMVERLTLMLRGATPDDEDEVPF